ncbi:nucleotidyltransferase domain-containing protein [Bacillus sp. DNRA2]|uniref:nucleotidyltransferase domain-containing protein n=1 Tax=Bacillus sp. DNRA2 TaxID=2723053 RepID=UPI00145F0851|nr:nucleotidyltransferase domain-containing protein [Bacillus sp. DNRA2]NMD71036.1 nucleotidyltransferase domain-containing protein [Bacillus sp. DNRA2]
MKEKILDQLHYIEQSHDVKIILAVESGSRAWGIPSESSDYDVRFIYVPKTDWYLSIEEKREVIDLPVNKQLDLHGWELRKALRLINKSNPHLLEWLHSQIVYHQNEKWVEAIRDVALLAFSKKAALFHYINMANRNYLAFLQGQEVKIKKYFYVLRPILACLWIEKNYSFPRLDFCDLANSTLSSGPIKESVNSLIQQKKADVVCGKTEQYKDLHLFIEKEIARLSAFAKSLPDEKIYLVPQLDMVFRGILQEAWSIETS